MELEQARFNMIEQQIRPWDVLDQNILDLLEKIPRDAFIDDKYRNLAYADIAIPLAHDQQMMHPIIEARMVQALQLDATDKVLEVGTGSGYVTAMLATLTHHVHSVDIHQDFIDHAATRLAKMGIENVTLETTDASQGWDKKGLYDVIAITGSLPTLPKSFQHSLNLGGRLFAIIGEGSIMEAILVCRSGENEWTRESLFETKLPMLANATGSELFVF